MVDWSPEPLRDLSEAREDTLDDEKDEDIGEVVWTSAGSLLRLGQRQHKEESLNMSILVKNQTFGHQFRPFSDQYSQKGPNSDQVRPIRTKSGNTAYPP